jgi:ribonuclease BN (tRNA processing enzyme)
MTEPIRLTFFGTAAGYPTEKRGTTTSVGLWRGESLYLLDAGAGAAAQFSKMGVLPDAVCAIFVSHMHVDHVGGLAPLLQLLQLCKRKRPLVLCLPAEGVEGFRDLLSLHYLLPDWLGFDLEILEVSEGPGYDDGGVAVEAIPNRHLEQFAERLRETGESRRGDSFSYAVVADGKRVLFSADLAYAWEVPERVKGADIAIVEIAHYQPEELGEALSGLALPRLVVTHVTRALEAVENELPARIKAAGYEGEVVVAHDGMELEV